MRGDFSRVTFRPEHHFSGVLLQQGRVQLDAEFNEQAAIAAHRDRATARDVIGPAGVPQDGGGFTISARSSLRGVSVGVGVGADAWAVGEDGTLLRAVGASAAWTLATTPTTAGLNAVHVLAQNGVAVGDGGAIVRLAGDAWVEAAPPPEVTADLHGVHVDAANAWAVGAAGTVLSRQDGGWRRQAADADVTATLRAVHFAGDVGVAVGDDGTILTTTDLGRTWSAQQAPAGSGDLYGVAVLDATHAWAVGAQGTVLYWDGTAWTVQPVVPRVTSALRAVVVTSAAEGTAVGDGGLALRFTDGTWRPEPTGVDADLLALAAAADGALLAVGDGVVIARPAPGQAWAPGPALPADGRTLTISAGDLYVEGVRCENEHAVSWHRQPEPPLDPAAFPPGPGTYGVFLHVQEQLLTAVEREDLREVALGGPDTATRARTVWQAGLVKLRGADPTCADVAAASPQDPPRGRLRARAVPAAVSTNACVVAPGGGYRRLENQLYRVEIHDGATYVWSRDNGSVTARLEDITTAAADHTAVATVSQIGRDTALGFGPEQIVEITDAGRLLRAQPGVLAQIDAIKGRRLMLSHVTEVPLTMADFPVDPIVRRWDGTGPIVTGTWVELEDGVSVEFAEGPDPADAFRTGDYWTIPARTLTGQVEWPRSGGEPRFEERHGPRRHTAPLAIATVDADGVWSGVRDCRKRFRPLTDLALLTRIFPLSGSGEDVLPGESVEVTVLVADEHGPVEGATVEFACAAGNGTIEQAKATTAAGIASCRWTPDAATPDAAMPTQYLTATLVAVPAPGILHVPAEARFVVNLNLAGDTFYAPPEPCPEMAGVHTVQAAINRLVGLVPRLYHVSGDGLEAPFRATVALSAGIANRCGVRDPKVAFERLRGEEWGGLTTVEPDGDGIATYSYEVTDEARQHLRAWLVDAGKPVGRPVYFTVSRAPSAVEGEGIVPAARVTMGDNGPVVENQGRTIVKFDGPPDFDTDKLFDPGDRSLRATRPGTYIATGEVSWDDAGGRSGHRGLELLQGDRPVGSVSGPPAPRVPTTQQVTAITWLGAGDLVLLAAQHSFSGALRISSATLSLAWLGP